MKISNFENGITGKILSRGRSYFEQGAVTELVEDAPGTWTADVEGSYGVVYEVTFRIQGDLVTDWSCTCPYDWGPVCKHVVAALLEYRENHWAGEAGVPGMVSEPEVAVSIADTPAALLAAFRTLTDDEQRVVKVAALIYSPFNAKQFTEIFNRANFRWQGNPINVMQASAALRQLQRHGFFERRGEVFTVRQTFAHDLCERFFDKDADFAKVAPLVRETFRMSIWYYNYQPADYFREMRLARYLDKPELFEQNYFNIIFHHAARYRQEDLLRFWLSETFDVDRLESLPPGIRYFLLSEKLTLQFFDLSAPNGYFYYASERVLSMPEKDRPLVARLLAQLYLLRGDWPALERVMPHVSSVDAAWLQGAWRLLRGDTAGAAASFAEAVKVLRKETGQRSEVLSNLGGVFQILTQLKTQDPAWLPKIDKHLKRVEKTGTSFALAFQWLGAVVLFLQNDKAAAKKRLKFQPEAPFLVRFFQFFCQFWVEERLVAIDGLNQYSEALTDRGYRWLEYEIDALRAELNLLDENRRAQLPERRAVLQIHEPLLRVLPRIEEWENALTILSQLGLDSRGGGEDKTSRLAWLVDFRGGRLQAREQTYGKNGWTKGRPVSYERLKSGVLDCLTAQDKRAIDEVVAAFGSEINVIDGKLWRTLIGHPLLFLWESPGTAVQLLEGKLSLIVREVESGYRVTLSHPVRSAGWQLVRETPTRYLLIEATDRIYQIAQAFNGESLHVPAKGADQLRAVVAGLSGVLDVQSVFEEEDLPAVEADARLHVHLLPVGDGFHVELYVKPFRETPPYVQPGVGEPILIAMLDGKRTSTTRDLQAEKKAVKYLLDQTPVLADRRPQKGIWELEEAKQCLDLLLQLDPLVQSGEIVLEWPKGEKLRIDKVVDIDQFRIDIRGRGTWFEVSGELPVDEDKVLNMRELLQLSDQQGQFIELSPGKFLALTESFRRRLREASGLLAGAGKGGTMRLHPLAAPVFEGFISELKQVQVDEEFQASRRRLEKAFASTFKPPRQFKAELRPYQREGYEWLQRCAVWGVGACLADDMGLGKTIQALAVLTDRASQGPALVVAPASVCRNWRAETLTFAPALNPILFGEGDRAATVEEAAAGDLIIVTYDLMTRESEHFHKKNFATLILDEAQAIKNRATKRSEAALALQAEFRMILTGTPLENHLGELWNLFQFINPGLLGTIEQFHERFALPIEKYGDADRREQLRRLVQPFILRRRKDEVLKELPEKTEVTLTVELPPEERAFYEALRRRALENLTADTGRHAGEQHLRILAELMRLRRAACHPSLVDANAGFTSSAKLRLFAEIVEELLDNGHKALVFSQFVGHLKILEDYLKKQNITYQYLDGQTPLAKRQDRIEAFQAGEGDIFLISLKAGGVGLNLTAADYVIHTDPWWNPAVEDQATDRAHRIGQEKPVTVYRLVAENTIEEKILQLHEQKRDLADSLLAGTDVSAKMTAEELLALLAN